MIIFFFLLALAFSFILYYFTQSFLSFAFGFVLFCILAGTFKRRNRDVYGTSRFANLFDLFKWGMLKKAKEGLFLGKYRSREVYTNGFEHVLVLAPTGGGKSSSFGIPNLVRWEGSTLSNDMSHELYRKTSRYLRVVKKSAVFLFSPMSLKTHRFNPFHGVEKLPAVERYGAITRIVEVVVPEIKDPNLKGFSVHARELVAGLASYLIAEKQYCNLGDLAELLSQNDFESWLKSTSSKSKDTRFMQSVNIYFGIPAPETRGGIMFSVTGALAMYLDPIVRNAVCISDFHFENMRKQRTDIFVGIPARDLKRLAPLVTLFWESACDELTYQEATGTDLPIFFNMDELGNLNRLNQLRRNLSIFRKYKIRCALYFQYKDQARDNYSKEEMEAFLNSKTKLVFTPDGYEDAEFLSKQLGKITRDYNTLSGGKFLGTFSEHIADRPLMNPDELMRLKEKVALVVISGKYGVKLKKGFYFKDRFWKKLNLFEADLKGDEHIPSWNVQFKPLANEAAKSKEAAGEKTDLPF